MIVQIYYTLFPATLQTFDVIFCNIMQLQHVMNSLYRYNIGKVTDID